MNPFIAPAVARPLEAGDAIWPGSEYAEPDKSKPEPAGEAVLSATEGKARMPVRRKKADFLGRNWRARKLLRNIGLVLPVLAPGLALAINVNSATVEQLQAVRGIGPKTAQIIVDERQRAGPYASFDDLSIRVKGIGPKKAATMQASGLTVEGAPEPKGPSGGVGRK